MKRLFFLLLICSVSQFSFGQYQNDLLPRKSPMRTVSQRVGFTDVTVQYGSPSVRGRDIFGALVPYGKVWRAGANEATVVSINSPIQVLGNDLPAGEYALFLIPQESKKWSVIFNQTPKQWGAYRYDKSNDALVVEIAPETVPLMEQLTFAIGGSGFDEGSISMHWADKKIEIPFEIDYLPVLQQKVQEKADAAEKMIKWVVYLQGAEFLVNETPHLLQAREWIDQAEVLSTASDRWDDNFYPRVYVLGNMYWTKAKVLAKEKAFADALEYGNKMKGLEGKTTFYSREKKDEKIDQMMAKWEKMAGGMKK